MNIIFYNFFDVSIDVLNQISRTKETSNYFAFSLQEVRKLLAIHKICKVIVYKLSKDENEQLACLMKSNSETDFYIIGYDSANAVQKKTNLHLISDITNLSEVLKIESILEKK